MSDFVKAANGTHGRGSTRTDTRAPVSKHRESVDGRGE